MESNALGHIHEWDEHKKKGWVYCWICGREEEYKQLNIQ